MGVVSTIIVRTCRGNVIAILDSNGVIVVQYEYDAWGNHTLSGSNLELGKINPFRYRSYYFDTETKLYFLQTRYYDPEVGRFINIDGIGYADPETINGLNLFAYCGNNPIMAIDPTGTAAWYEWFLSTVLVVCGGIACFIPGGQGIGVGLLTAGVSMTASNIMSSAGVNGKTASIISSSLDIVTGVALCFTPFKELGASFIGSGVVGIAGGYISEGLGGNFETGAAVGRLVGSFVGGNIYDYAKFSQIAKLGVLIGKTERGFKEIASLNGLAYYNGLPGYSKLSNILGERLVSQLGWAHNYHYIFNVMKYGGRIYNLGGSLTDSYGKEIALLWKFFYRILRF